MAKNEGHLGPPIAAVFTRYEPYARAAASSPNHIDHMRNCVSYFGRFLGEIKDPAAVTADDFRRYLADLQNKPVGMVLKTSKPGRSAVPASIPTRGLFRLF